MSSSLVFILYAHPLFGAAIRSLLESRPELRVESASIEDPGVSERLRALRPLAILVEGGTKAASFNLVSKICDECPETLVMGLTMEENTATVHYSEKVVNFSIEALLDLLESHSRGEGGAARSRRLRFASGKGRGR